ncbi:MAG TPA: universal stress protein, partial [Ilumatobacteraceae bacterium]|nr:universal stress protein [Ilumatobacteraceae bacterium]
MTNERLSVPGEGGSVPHTDGVVAQGIVVGYDDSPTAAIAADWAALEAVRRGETLRLVACSVVPNSVDYYGVGTRQNAALELAAARLHQRHPGLAIEQTSTPHDARDALAREAEGASMLVVGASGSHAL